VAGLLLASSIAGSAGVPSAPDEGQTGGEETVEVREGYLVNFAHRYYLPLGESWTLGENPEPDFQLLLHADRPRVVVKVLVSPDNSMSMKETVAALRDRAKEDPRVHVLQQSRRRIGLRSSADMLAVREGSADEPLTIVRTVTFSRSGNRYYLRMESPVKAYEAASEEFDAIVDGFKFESRLRFPWQRDDK
jgi:hypothetical protein